MIMALILYFVASLTGGALIGSYAADADWSWYRTCLVIGLFWGLLTLLYMAAKP